MSWAREHLFLEYAEFDGERERESDRKLYNKIENILCMHCVDIWYPNIQRDYDCRQFGEYLDYNDVAVVFVFLLSLVTMTMATTMMLIAIDMTNEGDKNLIHINRCVQYVTH